MNTAPRALSVKDATAAYGISRTKLYGLASEGKIVFRKAGKRTLILRDDLEQLLQSLPAAPLRKKTA